MLALLAREHAELMQAHGRQAALVEQLGIAVPCRPAAPVTVCGERSGEARRCRRDEIEIARRDGDGAVLGQPRRDFVHGSVLPYQPPMLVPPEPALTVPLALLLVIVPVVECSRPRSAPT